MRAAKTNEDLEEKYDGAKRKERARKCWRLYHEVSLGRLGMDPNNVSEERKHRWRKLSKRAGSSKHLPIFSLAEQWHVDTGTTEVTGEDRACVLVRVRGDWSGKGSAAALMVSFHSHVAVSLNA
jgi:hypothetical protein